MQCNGDSDEAMVYQSAAKEWGGMREGTFF